MEKPKLLLTGYRAYGDWIYTSPVLPFLFEKYYVFCDMNLKGEHLFFDDPRFAGKAIFIFEDKPVEQFARLAEERKIKMREQVKPDFEIDLIGTLEGACIARREQQEYNRPVGDRRVIYGSNGFYDAIFKRCGVELPLALNLEGLWIPRELEEWGLKWRAQLGDKFAVTIATNGSSIHKVFRNWRSLVDRILEKYDDAIVYLSGDDEKSLSAYKHERVRVLSHKSVPFKQAMYMMKYMDLVIGPETGLLVAAGMWGTPKMMLMSASSVWQANQYTRNDFSFQLPVPCSPCHLSVFELADCENVAKDGLEAMPLCVKRFPIDMIMDRVNYIYHGVRKTHKELVNV